MQREELLEIPDDRPLIIACGPLADDAFLGTIDELLANAASPEAGARGRLHYFDAASPIVAAYSFDESKMYRKSRYDKSFDSASLRDASLRMTTEGDGDYLNIPLDKAQYAELLDDLRTLERHGAKAFEETKYFEGCCRSKRWPIAATTHCFGPLKPVGLRDPRTGNDAVCGRATA